MAARAPITHSVAPAIVGLAVLVVMFFPTRGLGGQSLTIDPRPSALIIGLLFLAAILAVISPQLAARRGSAITVSTVTTVVALFNLANVVTPAISDRDFDLYGMLASLLVRPAKPPGIWEAAGVIGAAAAAGLAAVMVAMVAYWCWRRLFAFFGHRRRALIAAIVLGIVLNATAWAPQGAEPLATGLGLTALHQAAAFEAGWRLHHRPDRNPVVTPVNPEPRLSGNLAGLQGRDVYLVFIGSYGTTVFDTPEFRSALEGPLAQFETAISAAGYTVASGRLVAPTYGGGSWLDRATLVSGVRIDGPLTYSRVLASGRKLLPAYFRAAGWRTIEIRPGSKEPLPEAKAWGFDREIDARELDYRGPSFGWDRIPDQFTIARLANIRAALSPTDPVFTQIALISSHVPSAPVPPYLADWSDAGTFAGVSKAAWEEVYREPDWTRLAPTYLESLKYDFDVLRDWLCQRLPGRALVILVGDHQPPVVIGGRGQPWTVPIHVLSRDPALVAPFLAAGFVGGMKPAQPAPDPGMESFLRTFLTAYDKPSG